MTPLGGIILLIMFRKLQLHVRFGLGRPRHSLCQPVLLRSGAHRTGQRSKTRRQRKAHTHRSLRFPENAFA